MVSLGLGAGGMPLAAGMAPASHWPQPERPDQEGRCVAMRTKPLLGRKAWFGPRQLGWGLSPVSAEGWAVTAAAAAAAVGLAVADRSDRWTALIARKSVIVVIPLVVVVFLKGTSPGGRRAWEEFQASRERGGQ